MDDSICSLAHFIAEYGHIATENQVRWWIFNRESNEIERCGAIVKKGRRWYVNLPKLHTWILEGDTESRIA